ncbi:MAG: SRPBCC family protein [Myxococcota bacterium]
MMKRAESIEILASPEKVWSVAAGQFDRIGEWSSGVRSSRPLPLESEPNPGSSLGLAGRVCDTPQGETIEKFVAFDDGQRTFTYEVSGKAMPSFVKRATNTWVLKGLGPDRTQLTMTVEMETGGFVGAIMKPMMSMGMGKVLRTNLEDLKHFVETGELHQRKKKLVAA